MKKHILLVIFATICFLVSLLLCTGIKNIKKSEKEFAQRVELGRAMVQAYLNNKYVENMILTDEWSHYEYNNFLYYVAFPEDNPKYKFETRYEFPVSEHIEDYYLPTYLETEMEGIIKETMDYYFKNAQYTTSSSLHEDKDARYDYEKCELTIYYNIHKKPLSWYDPEHPNTLDYIIIDVYQDVEEPIDYSIIPSFINDLHNIWSNLGVDVESVYIYIYGENRKRSKFTEKFVYQLKNGEYVEK